MRNPPRSCSGVATGAGQRRWRCACGVGRGGGGLPGTPTGTCGTSSPPATHRGQRKRDAGIQALGRHVDACSNEMRVGALQTSAGVVPAAAAASTVPASVRRFGCAHPPLPGRRRRCQCSASPTFRTNPAVQRRPAAGGGRWRCERRHGTSAPRGPCGAAPRCRRHDHRRRRHCCAQQQAKAGCQQPTMQVMFTRSGAQPRRSRRRSKRARS